MFINTDLELAFKAIVMDCELLDLVLPELREKRAKRVELKKLLDCKRSKVKKILTHKPTAKIAIKFEVENENYNDYHEIDNYSNLIEYQSETNLPTIGDYYKVVL